MQYPPQSWFACRGEKVPRRDERRGVLARSRLPTLLRASDGSGRCFIRCFLWYRASEFRSAMAVPGASGLFQPTPTILRSGEVWRQARLGNLHLCVDTVTLEHVAHELMHAMVRRMQARSPEMHEVLEQLDGDRFYGRRADEELCYEMGRWVSALHAWVASFTVTAPRGHRRPPRPG